MKTISSYSELFSFQLIFHRISFSPYESIFGDLQKIYGKGGESSILWLDESANMKLYHCIENPKKRSMVKLSPVQTPKVRVGYYHRPNIQSWDPN